MVIIVEEYFTTALRIFCFAYRALLNLTLIQNLSRASQKNLSVVSALR